jgi:hypothetical protein
LDILVSSLSNIPTIWNSEKLLNNHFSFKQFPMVLLVLIRSSSSADFLYHFFTLGMIK